MTRAREPDSEGFVERAGVKIHYEVYGEGGPTILLMPTWTIIHKRFWKLQVPYLARHHRVVCYDGPGNGRSQRPLDPAAYHHDRQVQYALDVLDATGTDRAVVVGLSLGALWALQLAGEHGERVLGTVVIGASVPVTDPHPYRAPTESDPLNLPESRVPRVARDPMEHWAKYDPAFWQRRHEDFLWFFFGMCFPERRSTKPIEDCVGWGLDTSPDVLIAEKGTDPPTRETVEGWCRAVGSPVLAIHGDHDMISPVSRAHRIAELTGGECVVITGGGHIPLARDPVRVNHLIHELATRVAPTPRTRTWTRGRRRPKKVLYLSSPIGLGHARRDVAVAQALRGLRGDVHVDWLAQHPVTRLLERSGETVHPASAWLASESGHFESECGEHDLHCFEALRRMDEILLHDFHVFDDVVREGDYDLVVGDEAWDVDHFLHENPELKRFAYAWLTDFVGMLPMPDGGEREARLTADYNAEMIEHVERFPWVRDRAIFVGDPDDIVPDAFGPGLPGIREWTERHYDFSGYIIDAAPSRELDRAQLRQDLGWAPDERVCVVTVGGSGVGGHLLRRVSDAYDEARARVPGLRMVVVAGPRLDPDVVAARPGLEVHAFVPDLPRLLHAGDLAVVQGGLTTTMELTAAGRPFLYVPLRHHFEQSLHVRHRLERYGAGRCVTYEQVCDPDWLAQAIAEEIGAETAYLPVQTHGAERAAALLAELL
ncbi:MAG TPA: alpha/beta fold hydrolase [Nocardioides sp.]|uniref:alpha/beta hydrolase n=1 Tax=Nocardioides sp. TaxID=35761 RepID=UPI002D15D234|nr:alpha/beta fold hydrolase [Nocardioides sp.]HQR25399.1 alpha/beta fold hydrolase [Nocardioides sp.]